MASIADHLDEAAIRKMVLPRAKLVFTKNAGMKATEVAVSYGKKKEKIQYFECFDGFNLDFAHCGPFLGPV